MGLFNKLYNKFFSKSSGVEQKLIDSIWENIESRGLKTSDQNAYTFMNRSNTISIILADSKSKEYNEYRFETNIRAYKVR